MTKNKNKNKDVLTIGPSKDENIEIDWSNIKSIELPKSIQNQGFKSGLSLGSSSFYWKPIDKTTDKPIISIDTSVDEDIFQSNPAEISELQEAVKGVIKGYSQVNSDDDTAAIKQAAVALDVYWKTLEKFVKGNQISTPNFNRLLKKLIGVIIDPSHEKGNVVDLVKNISNSEVDAIIIDYWYNPLTHISQYKDQLTGGISYIKKKWIDYWKEFSSDPIEQINLIDKHENTELFYENISEKDIQVYFALLPKYMWRIAQNERINQNSRIGIFYIVAGWGDFLEHNEIIQGLNLNAGNDTNGAKISDVNPSFTVNPNFNNLIFKEKKI